MKDATKVRLKNNADNDKRPINKMLLTGVLVFFI